LLHFDTWMECCSRACNRPGSNDTNLGSKLHCYTLLSDRLASALQATFKLSSKSKSKGGHAGSGGGNNNAPPPLQALLPPVQPVGNVDCRVPVVLVVGGPGVGKTAVAAATLHDAFTYKGMRVRERESLHFASNSDLFAGVGVHGLYSKESQYS